MTALLMAAPKQAGGSVITRAAAAAGPRTHAVEDPAVSDFLRACKDLTAGVFDRAAAGYDRHGPRVFSHFGRRLVARAGVTSGATVLDVGTGRGAVLLPAAQRVGSTGYAVGIDLSPEMVRLTRADLSRAGITNAGVYRMDAEELRLADCSFDRVLCGFTLFLLPRPERALAECRRVLRPGGRLALTTWGEGDPRWSWYDELLRRFPSSVRPAPPALHRPAELASVVREAGFARVSVEQETIEVVYADEAEWWASLWSRGERAVIEGMEPEVADNFRAAAFEWLQPLRRTDGFHQHIQALVATAVSQSSERASAGPGRSDWSGCDNRAGRGRSAA